MSEKRGAEGGASDLNSFIALAPHKSGKKGKAKKKSTDPLVLGSLQSTLPIAIPATAPALHSTSAPPSPSNPAKAPQKVGFFKHFGRPTSPNPSSERARAGSGPASTPRGGNGHRPKWLPMRGGRRKAKSAEEVNGETYGDTSPEESFHNSSSSASLGQISSSASLGLVSSSVSLGLVALPRLPPRLVSPDNGGLLGPNGEVLDGEVLDGELAATPITTLPGHGQLLDCHDNPRVPTIMVSAHMEGDSCELEQNGALDEEFLRKMSQSSRHSQCSTLHSATSGVGSLLSDPPSDVESPLTPLSPLSGIGGYAEGMRDYAPLSDNDFIERDVPSERDVPLESGVLYSPGSDQESIKLTTPIPPRELSPEACMSGNESGSEKKVKKERRRSKGSRPWQRVKRVVQAFSPFALHYKKEYRWVQLAGHQGNFAPGKESGTIMKKSDKNEQVALQALMQDVLKPFVPEFRRVRERDGIMYVEMTDLLRDFDDPTVMDIKIGVRTYLEEELVKARTNEVFREDMYQKMIEVDPLEPTAEEHARRGITKPRYMQWREAVSSSSTLGFRLEGIKTSEGKALTDFKTTRSWEDVRAELRVYISESTHVKDSFLRRLKELHVVLQDSHYFSTHELIGSSLLFVYDSSGRNTVHMIDFGKTVCLPPGITVDHSSPWIEGNHEDGYLFGLDNLIRMWQEL